MGTKLPVKRTVTHLSGFFYLRQVIAPTLHCPEAPLIATILRRHFMRVSQIMRGASVINPVSIRVVPGGTECQSVPSVNNVRQK